MRRLISVLGVLSLLLAAAASPATAASPSASNPVGQILGVVPVRGQASRFAGGGSNLAYHKGPVEHTNKVYAIYWVPSGYTVSANYQSLINGFYTNVAADSGNTSNVYFSDTQYYDNTNGNVLYSSSFGGSYLDTDALPASGCTDSYTSVCVTDAQVLSEINHVITLNALNGWTANSSTEFFMFTAKGIGSCYGSSCSFSQFCAYHSWSGSGTSALLYANMPYADTVPAACDSGQHPNNDDADATINVASHEHNEAITDWAGNAWYDRRGYTTSVLE